MKHKKSSDREWGVKMLFNQRGEVLHDGKTLEEVLLNIKLPFIKLKIPRKIIEKAFPKKKGKK